MKWKGKRQSSNVEDRRGQSGSGRGIGGFNPMLLGPLIRLLFSKTGLILVGIFLVFSFITGNNPLSFLGQFFQGGDDQTQTSVPYQGSAAENELAAFSATILANTEDVWNGLLDDYREPTLVLFTGSVASACGSSRPSAPPGFSCRAVVPPSARTGACGRSSGSVAASASAASSLPDLRAGV